MSPIFTSGLPLVRSINAVSLTNSRGTITVLSSLHFLIGIGRSLMAPLPVP